MSGRLQPKSAGPHSESRRRSYVNALGALLGLALALGAGFALRFLDETRRPELLAYQALIQAPPDLPRALSLSLEAVRRDSANPYRWSDLGGVYTSLNDFPNARYCYQRALELSRKIPAIWLRDANFHFQLDETPAALVSAARVVTTVPDYDSTLFNYLDRVISNPAQVLAEIGGDRRATLAYTEHLLRTGNLSAGTQAWRFGMDKGFNDVRLSLLYVETLLKARQYEQAQRDWAASWGTDRGDYPDRNLLFNGDFEREPTGSSLDWRIMPLGEVETSRDKSAAKQGQWGIWVRFAGTANVSYSNVEQLVRVTPGPLTLKAWVRTEAITTNEGLRFQIVDSEAPARLDVRTASWTGSHDWTLISQTFTVPPATNLLAIRLVRQPSEEFNNRIKGSVWVDAVSLVRGK